MKYQQKNSSDSKTYDDIVFDCSAVEMVHPELFKPVVQKQKKAKRDEFDVYGSLSES